MTAGHLAVSQYTDYQNYPKYVLTFLTDVHYVDVSKILEQNIAAVTAQFNFWFDTCAWHRPSVLILDSLDKLLSAEVEVQVN